MANLDEIGQQLAITGVPATVPAGQRVSAGLTPELAGFTATEIVEHDVDLELIAKQVVFSNDDVADPNFAGDPAIEKILPLFDLTTIPPSLDSSGVPGLIGRLRGKLPVPVSDTPLSLEVVWRVEDENGNVLADNADYRALNGLDQPTLDLVFLPAFELFDASPPSSALRLLTANVTLTAGAQMWTGDVGPARLTVPAIPFPKALALTRNVDFEGAALVVVPGASAIASLDQLRDLLQPVRTAIQTLTSIARFAEMLTGVDTLTKILDATNIVFQKRDRIDNLNDIDLIKRPWYRNDIEAEDELSSLAYLSPPPPSEGSRHKVELCNDRDLDDDQGKFTLETGSAFVALCRSLHTKTPHLSTPSAALTVDKEPSGWRPSSPFSGISSFGDELSSLRLL